MSRITRKLHYFVFGMFTRAAWLLLLLIMVIAGSTVLLNHTLAGSAAFIQNTDQNPTVVTIPSGSSVVSIASILNEQGIISSPLYFRTLVKIEGLESSLRAGTYYFSRSEPVREVIARLESSDYRIPTNRVTLIEGEPRFKQVKRLESAIDDFDSDEYLAQTESLEGFLFPDTYAIPVTATTGEIISTMRKNFDTRIASLEEEIASSPYSLPEIITMASIIETEADGNYQTKQQVAGVLYRRLSIGMPLQADAVFSFIFEKHLPQVLFRHLEVDSPYNIYKNTGLPPGPIGNPGLDSIRAALNPIDTGNLYYITGKDGRFYYAKTFAEHNQNIRKYLR